MRSSVFLLQLSTCQMIPGVMYPHHLPQNELRQIRTSNERKLFENNLVPITKQELKEMSKQ